MKSLKLVGAGAIRMVCFTIDAVRLLWAVGFLFFAALFFWDLTKIPVSVNHSEDYAPEKALWEQKDPNDPMTKVGEIRMQFLQEHCHHIYRSKGFVNYYCPLCRKKLLKGTVPLWQI